MGEVRPYFMELDAFGQKLKAEFPSSATNIRMVSNAGGVPSMQGNLQELDYDDAKAWLQSQFGEPKLIERWHTSQRPKTPILQYSTRGKFSQIDHVNLIRMHNQKRLRFTLVSWM